MVSLKLSHFTSEGSTPLLIAVESYVIDLISERYSRFHHSQCSHSVGLEQVCSTRTLTLPGRSPLCSSQTFVKQRSNRCERGLGRRNQPWVDRDHCQSRTAADHGCSFQVLPQRNGCSAPTGRAGRCLSRSGMEAFAAGRGFLCHSWSGLHLGYEEKPMRCFCP